MDLSNEKENLIKVLRKKNSKRFNIVVMPHFCIDNFVHCNQKPDIFINNLKALLAQGGGNITFSQELHCGGKAANCASALSSLGLHVTLIAKTSILGYKLLKHFFAGKDVELSHVAKDGGLAFTTALELEGSNLMLSYAGSLENFGPEFISSRDEKIIKKADVVCISDWGLNNKGTALAQHVFSIAKEGKAKTFFDPGDPSPKGKKEHKEIEGINRLLAKGLIDMLSVNENEVIRYGTIDFLKKFTMVELHTASYAMSASKNFTTEKVPAFNVSPLRLTGAGDAWAAGDIFGLCLSLPAVQRLMLAHAVAAYYISQPQGKHAKRHEVASFLEDARFKQI